MLIGTIDFYHFVPLLVALNLAWGHKVSRKQNLLVTFSDTPFNWRGWNLVGCWHDFSWKSCCHFLERDFRSEGRTCCFADCIKKKSNAVHAFWCLETDLVHTWYDDRHYWTWCFDSDLWDLYVESRSQGCIESKNVFANYPQKLVVGLDGIWSAVEACWSVESHAHCIPAISIQGRAPSLDDVIKEAFMLACILQIFFHTWCDKTHQKNV